MTGARKLIWAPVLLAVLAVTALPAVVGAQEWKTIQDDRWCRDGHWGGDDDETYCEVREITLKGDRDVIRVDGGANGGIEVEGWDKNEIRVRVKIRAWSRDEDDARETVEAIEINTGREIRAEGPSQRHHNGWSVSYRLMVPKKSNLDLEANNGGLSVSDVEGDIRLDTTNGGLSIANLAGDVRGRTTNGGLHVQLAGKSWKGEGLDVTSTNGGVDLEIPENYSAELETGTVNGGIDVEFPVTVQGRINRSFKATLGDGGAKIRVKTTNGGVRIYRG